MIGSGTADRTVESRGRQLQRLVGRRPPGLRSFAFVERECTAITEDLDHLVGEPVLTGLTPKERAIVHMMQRSAEAGVLDAVGAYFHHATPGLGPQLETYQNREWGEKCRERAIAGARHLNDVLRERAYLACERFTMADITAFAGLAFADFAGVELPKELDALRHWQDRVAARPSASHAWEDPR